MAFCNSCGANLEPGAKFCAKCGASLPASGAPAAAPSPMAPVTPAPAAAAPTGGSSALKIILIIVAVIVGIGIIGVASVSYFVYRVAHGTHVRERNGNVSVETPFGKVESTTDPSEAARDLDIDIYPGATVVKGTTANMTIGNMHTAAADFETDDPPNTVADFYKNKVPNAQMMSSQGDRYGIVTTDKKNMLTINIEPQNGKTRIHIARVTGKGSSSE